MKRAVRCALQMLFLAGLSVVTGYGQVSLDFAMLLNDGDGYSNDVVNGYAVDAAGNVYVTGSVPPTSGNIEDALTIKYNASGVEQWRARYDGGYGSDWGQSIALDGSGNVYVGMSSRGVSNQDYVIIKYNSSGDSLFLKMNSSGDTLWSSVYRGPSNRSDFAHAIAYDGHGGIYVSGSAHNGTDEDIVLVRMDTTGAVLWDVTYDRPGGDNNEIAPALAVDTAGNAYLAGSTWPRWWASFTPSIDFTVLRFDRETGDLTWSAFYNGTADNSYEEAARGIAVDKTGNVYVAGMSINTTSGYDFTVLRYSQSVPLPVQMASFTATARGTNAELTWRTETETGNHGFDIERRVVHGSKFMIQGNESMDHAPGTWNLIGFVQGAGTSSSPRDYSFVDKPDRPGRYAYRIKQIDQSGTFTYTSSLEVLVGFAPLEFTLSQNYPNPFNPTTTIEFTLPEDGRVKLRIYNMLGEEMAMLVDEERKAGVYQQIVFDASRLATGVYVSRLEFKEKQLIKKMLLVK